MGANGRETSLGQLQVVAYLHAKAVGIIISLLRRQIVLS